MNARTRTARVVTLLLGFVVLSALAVPAVFAGGSSESSSASQPSSNSMPDYLVGAKKGPYVIGLSNSFSGNSWRAQMVAEFKFAAEKQKSDGTLKDYVVADATGNTASQIQQINNMISRGVDAILVDANSATALDPVIKTAHEAGILVVSFDNTVTSPYSINVNTDQTKFGSVGADWLVKKLNGKGNIIVLNGVAGTPVNNERWQAAKKIFDQNPGIKILSEVNANWDQATAQQAVANLLPSFPKIDGIWSQGGAMTLGAIYAFQAAGRPLPPMTGEANNGLLKEWRKLQGTGFDSIAPAQPPSLSVEALKTAIKALQGQDVKQTILLNPPVITDQNLDQYVRTDMPDSLWLPTDLTPEQLKTLFGGSKS